MSEEKKSVDKFDEAILSKFKSKLISQRDSAPGEQEWTIASTDVVEFLSFLKSEEGGGFNHLADLTCYDEKVEGGRFHVVYALTSMVNKKSCMVVARIKDEESPRVASVVELWAGAGWLEREVYDLMGISFDSHPDLRRILLPKDFKGHPLQKDFIVDYRQSFENENSEEDGFDPYGTTVVRGER